MVDKHAAGNPYRVWSRSHTWLSLLEVGECAEVSDIHGGGAKVTEGAKFYYRHLNHLECVANDGGHAPCVELE